MQYLQKQAFLRIDPNCRATQHVGSNLPLTSNQKFRCGLACSYLARPKWNFCSDVNRRFEPTCCVTLYICLRQQIKEKEEADKIAYEEAIEGGEDLTVTFFLFFA